MIRQAFPLAAVALVFCAVAQEIPVELLDDAHCHRYFRPRSLNGLHHMGVPGDFLFVACTE